MIKKDKERQVSTGFGNKEKVQREGVTGFQFTRGGGLGTEPHTPRSAGEARGGRHKDPGQAGSREVRWSRGESQGLSSEASPSLFSKMRET